MILRRGIYSQKRISNTFQQIKCNSSSKDVIDLGNSILAGVRSFESWLYIPTFQGGNDYIMYNNEGQSDGAVSISFRNAGGLRLAVSQGGSTTYTDTNTAVPLATFFHYAFTIDSSNGLKVYLNGVLQTDTASSITGALVSTTNALELAGNTISDFRYIDCTYKEVRFWTDVRTGSEILANKDVEIPSGTSGLKEVWRFADETGATVTGEKGATGTILTSNAGGTTYINSTMRETI